MKLISDVKLTGSVKMLRLHVFPKYHICFLSINNFDVKTSFCISLMKSSKVPGYYMTVKTLWNN